MLAPKIETVPAVGGHVICPNEHCGIVVVIVRDKDGVYRRTRGCSHEVVVRMRNGNFEIDYVRSNDDA